MANLTDARYFAALGVDYLGFPLEPGTAGQVGPLEIAAFREWVEGPELVGEFGGTPAGQVARLADELDLHLVQVGTFADVAAVAAAAGGRAVLQSLALGPDFGPGEAQAALDRGAGDVRGFVLDFSRAGLAWSRLRENTAWMRWLEATCADYEVLLDVPADAADLDEILAVLAPTGLQLRGGDEEAVGVKSFDDLDEWFDVLRVEE